MAKTQPPGDYEIQHRDSSGVEPPNPNERLQQLQSELSQHNARIDHLSKQRDALQTDITDLTANWTEVKTTLANYAAALQDLESRLQALQYFFEQKDKMVLAAIGEEKDPIDELIRKFDHEIETMMRRLTELGKPVTTATHGMTFSAASTNFTAAMGACSSLVGDSQPAR
jgi:chromosome segregation ATPase